MKIITNTICAAFAVVILVIGALTADGGPGDLIAPQYHGYVFQLPINPSFGTPSLYSDNANLPGHAWAGCAFDRAGNLYLLEQPGCVNCNNIYKLSPDRTTLSLFASGIAGGELLVDAAGNIYEAEEDANTCTIFIYKFDPQTAVRSTFATINVTLDCGGSGGFGAMAFDSRGNLFIASGQYGVPNQLPIVKIFKVDPQGQVSEFVDLPNAYQAGDIAFDSAGNLFVLAVNSYSIPIQRRLFVYTSNGTGPSIFGATQNDPECAIGTRFGNHMVIDSAGNIYLSSLAATITQYPQTYACGDSVPSIYIGVEWWNAYETLGQLAIQPTLCTSDTWETKAPSLQAVAVVAGAVVNGQFYVIDGSAGGGVMPPPQVYDPVANTWSYKAPDPILRANTSVGVLNNKIYVAEGWINADSNRATQALEIYDPATNSWRTAKQSTVARGGAASTVINGKLYVTGGSKNGGRVQPKDLEIYDPVRDKWSTGAPLPTATGGQGTALNGKFYIVGGVVRGVNTGVLQIYDPATNRWTQGAPMPTARGGVMPVAVDGKLYVIGGNNGVNLSTVEIYDPASNTWTTGTSAPTARNGGTVGVINSKVYATGGFASNMIDGSLDVYTAACP